MTSALVQQLTGIRDLKKILETTVKELGETFQADICQVMLSSPLDSNVVSICDYQALSAGSDYSQLPNITLPLNLEGKAFGHVRLARANEITADETASIRGILGEMGDIIRHAQINDIVQRDTFRNTFLVEIGNVMSYSLGIGDALFMVVNILGKVLQASRCMFICTDDTQAGWRCYEFWQQDKVESCQSYCWPTADSPSVAQSLLASAPLTVYEGQQNSYLTPVQEELILIGARCLLGVPLRSQEGTHGCVILQQCDYRRAWTRGEMDMVQSVADKVAEALLKLPAEKRVAEPIMQLHQRTIALSEAEDKQSIQSVRRALKGALGQQAIPAAQKTTTPPTPAPAAAQTLQQATPPATQPTPSAPQAAPTSSQAAPPAPQTTQPLSKATLPPASPASPEAPQVVPSAAASAGSIVSPEHSASAGQEASKGLSSILGGMKQEGAAAAMPAFDLGVENDLESPGALKTDAQPESLWGDLDAIPTPAGGGGKPGLGTLSKSKPAGNSMTSPLMASFHKDKTKYASELQASEYIEGPPLEIDEQAAQAKFNEILSSTNPTSDYIFATPGLDARVLGRIDGWIAQIEGKDKYKAGHARQVAEYSCAIARQAGLSEQEVNTVRLAALLHDVGKLGTAASILQKSDEELSDTELLVVMKHPLDGAELLESFGELKHLAPIVRAHHEEFDGNGYPDGAKGEEIPTLARIIAVADSYHQMTSPLCYRQGISPTEAKQVLTAGAGKQWDPRFVEALIITCR